METKQIGQFFGEMFAFNNSLKLFHWHVTGKGSYAQHMALDQAIDDMKEVLDGIVETSYAVYGDIDVVIPETKAPKDIVKHCETFFNDLEKGRKLVEKYSFIEAEIDEYQQAVQQLLYRLKRLQ